MERALESHDRAVAGGGSNCGEQVCSGTPRALGCCRFPADRQQRKRAGFFRHTACAALLPVPGRSSASWTPTPFGQSQKRSGAFVGVSLLTIWRAAAAIEASRFLQARRVPCVAAGSRQIVSKLDCHALRAESKAVRRFCPEGVGVSSLTIWRAAAAMNDHWPR